MRAFIGSCRRMVAVGGFVVLGAALATFGSGSAQAQNIDRWLEKSFASSEQPHKSARRMRLGASRTERARESLTGGSRRISSRKSKRTRKTASTRHRKGVRVASLGGGYQPKPELGRSLSGGGVKWVANSGCLNSSLRAVVYQVASNFGPVTVNSTCRSRRHNARVGGAHRSHHLSGNAVDFRVHGRGARGVYAFLRSHPSVGGLKFYRRGFFHIDTGSRRTW
ncbi:MAG TPA: D-Ala-D-Ala carboxypeptidase family metallohydrolase [Hyphomicrobiaceae bacterium]|nr:D-Ala-D-Ala carboxypeptidase family metallohydrolase [Hyphomicrobiaceae bacterium]